MSDTTLEFVAKDKLNGSRTVEHGPASTSRHTKGGISRDAIQLAESMAGKGVGNIGFEGQELIFSNGRSLDDRKILVDISGSANLAQRDWKIAEGVSTL